MTTPREDELFLAFKRRPGPETLAALLRGCQDSVYNLCHQVLRHPEDAEDVSQEVLVEAARALPSIDAPRQLKVWLYKAALHRSLNLKAARARRIELARRIKAADSTPDADDRVDLWLAISDLDDRDRCLLLEHYFDKLTLEEIGAREGVSGVAIWKRLESARDQLRRALAGVAVVPLLESLTPAVAPPGLAAQAVAAGGIIVGTKSALSAGVVVVVALLMGAAATGGYVVGSRRPDNVRATEPVTRVATTKPEIILPSAPVMPSPEPPAKTESAKIGRRPESSEKDPAPPGRPVIDPRKVRYGRMPKPLPEDVLNAESWPEFYQRAKERRVNSELLEDLIFQRLSKELRLDSKTTQALHRLFEAEREAVTQAIVDAGGGPNSFEKKSDELGMNWNAVYADWNRQRDIVRQTHENEYLKHLTYDQLVFFNSHLRNSTIQLETCYANDEVYYLVSGVGIPVK